ncbi:glycoside hydrolase family 43 protein [Phlebiopsis gigantea 11061_1 CR5-6]|uniref:Glycoside hydrolase family 43 protein n=1 Tax=Phlebiopsis gigantea (strain 11061_1 CR5-6) TaxID=745531 RepID=A0A0C3S3Z6_PHLG1|nr:glycoside hydrolase family 43 protein [Phlebiopsis gigantea 11061_1 CR5-6]
MPPQSALRPPMPHDKRNRAGILPPPGRRQLRRLSTDDEERRVLWRREYKSSFKPLGADSRDKSVFQDTAQTAYLLYASDNNQNFKIAQLDADYYNVTAVTSELTGACCARPAHQVTDRPG